jgi:carboxylesterase type B
LILFTGAISLGFHMTSVLATNPGHASQYYGNSQRRFPLFDQAILQSASGVFKMTPCEELSNTYFTKVLEATNCTSNLTTLSPMECLRQLPTDQYFRLASDATGGATNGPCLDGTYLVRKGIDAINNGQFARIPLLLGDDTDEGTAFAAFFGIFSEDRFAQLLSERTALDEANRTAVRSTLPVVFLVAFRGQNKKKKMKTKKIKKKSLKFPWNT